METIKDVEWIVEFSIKQKEILAQFFCNYAVAWMAGGVIGPFVVGWGSVGFPQLVVITSLVNIALSIIVMLSLEGRKVI